jgi:hypothetical protein
MLPGRVKRERHPAPAVQVGSEGGWRPADPTARSVVVEPDISRYMNDSSRTPNGASDASRSLGEMAMVGVWAVTVTAFIPDATAEIMAMNAFNDVPSEGVYSMATIAVTYHGDTEGSAYSDLRFVLRGGDAVQYADSESITVMPQSLSDAHTLEHGGSATGNVSFDCPAAALPGATVFVERIIDFDGTSRRHWCTS